MGMQSVIGSIKSLRPRRPVRRAIVAAFLVIASAGLAAEIVGAVIRLAQRN